MESTETYADPELNHGLSTGFNAQAYSHDSRLEHIEALPHYEHASIPQADGGQRAWLFLIACFFVEGLVWGFAYSFGVFQEYYTTHEPFSKDPSGIATIGSSAMVHVFPFLID